MILIDDPDEESASPDTVREWFYTQLRGAPRMDIQAAANLLEDISTAMKRQPKDGYIQFQVWLETESEWRAPKSWENLFTYLRAPSPALYIRRRPPVVRVEGEIPIETLEVAKRAYRFCTAGSDGAIVARALLILAGGNPDE